MYTVRDYGRMMSDEVRLEAYRAAIAASVVPGDVVIDLGAGTGICTLLALRAGASHVYAIESNAAVRLLPEVCARNGFKGKVTVVQGSSTTFVPERPVDVVVSDLRGVSPLFTGHLASLADARARLLKPGGKLIPGRDRLFAALVTAEDTHTAIFRPHFDAPLGFDFSSVGSALFDAFHHDRDVPIGRDQVLSEAFSWGELCYGEAPPELVRGEGTVRAVREGTAHGLVVWFEGALCDGVTLSSFDCKVYARGFLPLRRPLDLHAGDRVELTLGARATQDDYVWAWTVGREGAASSEVERHHTLHAFLLNPGSTQK